MMQIMSADWIFESPSRALKSVEVLCRLLGDAKIVRHVQRSGNAKLSERYGLGADVLERGRVGL